MNTNKTIIDSYFAANYKKLITVAKNCLRKLKEEDSASQLVSDAYLYVVELPSPIETTSKLESIIVNYISKQTVWDGTTFKKNYVNLPKNETMFELSTNDLDYEEEQQELDYNDSMDTFMSNLEELRDSLPIEKKILFDLIYKEGINTSGKLYTHLGGRVNRTYCWKMIKEIKEYVTNNKELNDNYTTNIRRRMLNYSGC
jgi:hypothetical protein